MDTATLFADILTAVGQDAALLVARAPPEDAWEKRVSDSISADAAVSRHASYMTTYGHFLTHMRELICCLVRYD